MWLPLKRVWEKVCYDNSLTLLNQIIVMAAQNVNLILSLAMLRASEAVNVALSKIFI